MFNSFNSFNSLTFRDETPNVFWHIINLVLFGLIACETSDNSTGFYTGDSLATKKTNQVEEISVEQEKEQITEKEILAETNPIITEEYSEISEEELDYK